MVKGQLALNLLDGVGVVVRRCSAEKDIRCQMCWSKNVTCNPLEIFYFHKLGKKRAFQAAEDFLKKINSKGSLALGKTKAECNTTSATELWEQQNMEEQPNKNDSKHTIKNR